MKFLMSLLLWSALGGPIAGTARVDRLHGDMPAIAPLVLVDGIGGLATDFAVYGEVLPPVERFGDLGLSDGRESAIEQDEVQGGSSSPCSTSPVELVLPLPSRLSLHRGHSDPAPDSATKNRVLRC